MSVDGYQRTVGNYFRKFEDIDIRDDRKGQFSSTCAAQFDSAVIMKSVAPPGKGVMPHKHPVNQFLFMAYGELDLFIGSETYHLNSHELVFIPAGIPHRNLNPTPTDELHIEIVSPNRTNWAESAELGDERTPEGLEIVRRIDPDRYMKSEIGGLTQQWLVDRSSGGDYAAIRMDRMEPGCAGPLMHMHRFDSYMFVVEGSLNVEIAGRRHLATPHELVIVPAGVPHTQWNEGDEPEEHLSIVAPQPQPHERWSIDVDFKAHSPWEE